jgi:ribosomal protein S18 acetylase RimI-like enzyme
MLGGSFLTFGETPVAIFDNPDTPVFVYEREGAVLGYAFCVLRHQESGALMPLMTLYLDDLCVLESARGLHIGTALFEYVKAYAKEKGCHNITLHVWKGNPGAKAFYEAQGMTPQYTSMELLCK